MAKILIDGRFVGVGDSQTRYVLELVQNLLVIDSENQYTLLIRPQGIKDSCEWLSVSDEDRKIFIEKCKLKIENLTVTVMDIPHYSLTEQTKLLNYLNKNKFDLVHFTQFNHPVRYRGKYITTIQDLTLVGHLHRQNILKKVAYNLVMKSAAKDSSRVIAISQETEKDIIDYYKIPKSKIDVIYHGIDHERFSVGIKDKELKIKSFKDKYKIDAEYILYTGAWKKHKNLLRMLKAYEQFKLQAQNNKSQINSNIQNIKLVLVGKIDEKEPEVIAEIKRINEKLFKTMPNAIITTGFIEDPELPIAYAGALVYCIPSLSEGFGWPPLEAMACGTPVISSNLSCMPEILGGAALYFDPYNIEEITNSIKRIISDASLRLSFSAKGLEQVNIYNWENTAKKTLETYKKVLA